ncbi:MAG: (d)CMP kinase [Actinomycetales bacterium]|nr:(d)CMP kinase [Actinomycetales bacterium]
MTEPIVIAIDGPSGSGKSSTSRGVADRLGLAYLDTGSMYRAMTLAMLRAGVDLDDPKAIAAAVPTATIHAGTHPLNPTIELNGVDVAEAIRTSEVTAAVSKVAAVPAVRTVLVESQKLAIDTAIAGIVIEGRDIGTVVAPNATLKIYLYADPVARAQRRAAEMGVDDEEAMREALALRDAIDSNRAASPLKQSADAVLVDGTHQTLAEVIDAIVAMLPEANG